jgi:hypothetical protein
VRPRQARYQAALRPDTVSILIIQISRTGMLPNSSAPRWLCKITTGGCLRENVLKSAPPVEEREK